MNAADLDAVWNRLALSLARSTRLVESWLPPIYDSSDDRNCPSDHDAVESTPGPVNGGLDPDYSSTPTRDSFSDIAGIGYQPSSTSLDATPKRSLASNERLRSLLLGSQAGRKAGQREQAVGKRPVVQLMGSEPTEKLIGSASTLAQRGAGPSQTEKQPMKRRIPAEMSDGEEELGRSAIGKRRTPKT